MYVCTYITYVCVHIDIDIHIFPSALSVFQASLQQTATHCNTLQHTATRCNTLQHTATHYNTRVIILSGVGAGS